MPMDDALVPILVACTVAALAFGGVQIAALVLNNDRKKLKERLRAELHNTRVPAGTVVTAAQSIVTPRPDVDRVTAALVRWAPMAALNARVGQAFPDTSLVRFLAIVLGC